MGQDNIIELNGKRYDAVSGAFLGESRIKAVPAKHDLQRQGRVIDGFMRANKSPALTPTVITPAVPSKDTVPQPTQKVIRKQMDIRRATSPVKAHRPERSKTLMRHVVNKPKTAIKPDIKTTAPTEMMARPVAALAKPLEKKLSVTQVNPVRLARARHVAKSQHIQRFSHPHQQHRNVLEAGTQPGTTRPVPHLPAVVPATVTQARTVSHSIVLAKAKQEMAAQKVDIFEAALAQAISHEQLPPQHVKQRRSHKRLVNVMAGVGAFLIIGGFITYLNMPKIELQFASMRAGFHAELPGYQPMGYAREGGIQTADGKVTMRFRSGDSAYQITQQASDWNSATLLDQKTEAQGAPAKTVQSKGRIIYLYNNAATWVNGGVHYEISGDASLDADELVSLATSM